MFVNTVVGSFATRSEVKDAIRALHRNGIPNSAIGIIGRNDDSADCQHAYCKGALGIRVAAAGTGTLVGRLVKLGMPQETASYCRTEVSSGRLLIVVQADSRIERVNEILDQSGGMILASS